MWVLITKLLHVKYCLWYLIIIQSCVYTGHKRIKKYLLHFHVMRIKSNFYVDYHIFQYFNNITKKSFFPAKTGENLNILNTFYHPLHSRSFRKLCYEVLLSCMKNHKIENCGWFKNNLFDNIQLLIVSFVLFKRF